MLFQVVVVVVVVAVAVAVAAVVDLSALFVPVCADILRTSSLYISLVTCLLFAYILRLFCLPTYAYINMECSCLQIRYCKQFKMYDVYILLE